MLTNFNHEVVSICQKHFLHLITWSCCLYPSFCLLSLFGLSVMSNTLWSHGLQQAGFPVLHHLLKFAQTHDNWVSDTIKPSHRLSSPSPPAFNLRKISVFLMSQLFASGGQSTGASALASVLPMNIQDWFPLGWIGWISLQSKGLSRVFSNNPWIKNES